MKVLCAEHCGNAPKKLLLRDVTVDYWKDGGQQLIDELSDEAKWRVAGGPCHAGKEVIQARLADRRSGRPIELHIHNIITHGNTAAINVTVVMEDGDHIEYCDVYKFAGFGQSAKIKEITSYQIGTEF